MPWACPLVHTNKSLRRLRLRAAGTFCHRLRILKVEALQRLADYYAFAVAGASPHLITEMLLPMKTFRCSHVTSRSISRTPPALPAGVALGYLPSEAAMAAFGSRAGRPLEGAWERVTGAGSPAPTSPARRSATGWCLPTTRRTCVPAVGRPR